MTDTPQNADTPRPIKRRSNNQIASKEDRHKLQEDFARWMIIQGAKHRDQRQTLREYAVVCGVTQPTLSEWKKSPDVADMIRKLMPDVMASYTPELYPAMARYALAGNPAMMKLALQQAKMLEAEKTENKHLHAHVSFNNEVRRPTIDKHMGDDGYKPVFSDTESRTEAESTDVV